MAIFVIGDLHAQADKFWAIVREAGLADADGRPSARLRSGGDAHLVLLGDLVHPKSRARYGALLGLSAYDEHDPDHVRAAERFQEAFLRSVQAFASEAERMTVILGNHDHNAIDDAQGPLRTDDVGHLEWKPQAGGALPDDLRVWIETWPREALIDGVHLAHVGPRADHNVFDEAFYLENRRRWIYADEDLVAQAGYRLGVYGHTPVRGGVNFASRGRAILLDLNGQGAEYGYLEIRPEGDAYRARLRGLVFDGLVGGAPEPTA
jgi:hypothetical protein